MALMPQRSLWIQQNLEYFQLNFYSLAVILHLEQKAMDVRQDVIGADLKAIMELLKKPHAL